LEQCFRLYALSFFAIAAPANIGCWSLLRRHACHTNACSVFLFIAADAFLIYAITAQMSPAVISQLVNWFDNWLLVRSLLIPSPLAGFTPLVSSLPTVTTSSTRLHWFGRYISRHFFHRSLKVNTFIGFSANSCSLLPAVASIGCRHWVTGLLTNNTSSFSHIASRLLTPRRGQVGMAINSRLPLPIPLPLAELRRHCRHILNSHFRQSPSYAVAVIIGHYHLPSLLSFALLFCYCLEERGERREERR